MALALGMSVAVAQPTITADSNGTDISTDLGLTWQDTNPSTALSYIPSISGGSTAIEKITFGFNGSSNTHSGDSTNYSASVATTTSSLFINGNNKGLQIGASGAGKIILDFGTNDSKNITLNLNGVASTEYGLKGDLEVSGTGTSDTFTGTFGGKGVSGSLLLGGSAKKVINFTGNAEIGSWIDGAGEREINFTGTATTKQIWNSGGGTATVIFSSTANIQRLGSEAFHVQDKNSTASINNITFNGNATIQGYFSAYGYTTGIENKNVAIFKGQTNTITGNVYAWGDSNNQSRGATNDLTFADTTQTNTITGNVITAVASGIKNIITFNGQTSNKIEGDIQGGSGTNQINFNGVANTENIITGEIKTTGGQNLILFNQGKVKILGNITSQEAGYLNGNNQLIFKTSSILGDTSKINIQIKNSEADPSVGYNRHSYNTLIFNSQTTAKIANLSVSGDLGQKTLTFNALSLNNDSSKLNIDSITAYRGSNIIGKNIVTLSSDSPSYNTSLFGNSSPSIQNDFSTNFMQTTFQATGTFNFGNITANGEGTNCINVNTLTLGGNIEADGGANNINVNTLNANSTQISAVNYGKNIINIAQDTRIQSIAILATSNDHAYDKSKNTLNFSGDTLTISSGISTQGKWASSGINEVNIKKDNATLNISSGGITTYKANETYDRQKTQQNNITFSNGGKLNLIAGNISVQHGNQNNFTFNGTNDVTITLSDGSIQASDWQSINSFSFSGANNAINSSMTQSNGGANNITFLSDSSTLKLTGVTNQISTLTAKSSATTGDTLIIDSTNNANTTSIDSVANGDTLIVKFKGQGENKGATLNLKSTPTLKQVIIDNNSTYNTLNLAQTTTTIINTKIAIADTQQLAINLNNTELALYKDTADNNLGLTTTGSGISTINVSNTGTLSGGDIVATNLNLSGTANAILKSANTTFANLIANGGTLTLGEGSSNATISSTDSIFNATFAGTASQTLAINGGENTITTLTLNAQSDTLSIGGGSTTITSAITSDTGNNLTLQIGDSSKSASLTLSGAITATNGVANVIFTGSTTASSNLATLTLGGSSNTLTGVTTQTANALIEAGASTSNLGALTFSGANGIQSLQINGGTNTISSLTLSNANNILTQNAGNTTITNPISVDANQNLTLALISSSDRLNPSETSVTLSGAITKGSGVANVTFTGGTDNQHYYSDLILTKSGNTLSSVTSNAKNARITMKDTAGATIDTTTIGSNSSLVFGFTGSGASTVTLSDGITVGSGSTLGISLGVSDATTQTISGNITLQDGSTLLVDFLNGNKGSATLGNLGAITIGENRNSIINFHGTNSGSLNGSGITLDGGTNTINFLGSAEIGSQLTLRRGTNYINVYAPKSGVKTDAITATIVTSQVGSVSNTINLDDYATLDLKSGSGAGSGSGTLTSSGLANTLNFKGNEAIFKGGFGATSTTQGSATINVGSADKEIVSGTITGAVSNASLNFNAGTSILTLQSQTNTFTAINSKAKNGVLVLDTTSNQVDATISGKTTISTDKSLSFDFQGNNASTITTTGGLVIDGTLGVIISGSGAKKVVGDIDLNGKGTLYVNYAGGNATVTLGDGDGITIGKGESSIIDFNSTSGTLANALTLDGGSNTINFNQSAELDKITLTSGYNTFNVADTKTATIGDTSDVDGVHNTINLGAGSTINLKSGSGSGDGSGSIITSLNNTLYFNGNGATLKGSFGANKGGSARVNVAGSNSVITGSLSNASITFASDNADLTLQSGDSTITSLKGYTAPSTYTRNGRTITRTISNTLTLDDTGNTNAISATITSAVVGDSVGLKFGNGGEEKTFTFSASGNHLTGVAFGTTSTNNTLAFTNGNSTLDSVTLASGSDLTIKLGDANLTLTGGYTKGSGTSANLSITGSAGIIANNQIISVNTLSFDNATASSLSVSNSGTNTFASVNASKAGTLIANDSTLTITALIGSNLTAGFSGTNASRIAISGGNTITLAGIVLNNNANGTLDLSSLTNTTITNNVSVGANQSLAINLGGTDTTLAFTGGLSGNATINAGATTSNTIAGSSIALSNLNLSGATNTTTLTAGNISIDRINANATGTNTLKLDASNGNVSASINSIGSTTRSAGSLDIALNGSAHTTTLSLNGNTINSLDIQGDNNNLVGNAKIGTLSNTLASGTLNINGGNVEVTSAITPASGHNLNLALNNSTLSLGATSTITSLSGKGGVIDFVSSGKDTSKKLTITGNCDANANVITYVSGNQANIVEASNDTGSGTLTISAVGSADEIFSITYEDGGKNNVKVAQIGSSGTDKAVGGTSDVEGEIIQISLSADGKGGYYIGSAISKGVDTSVQEVVTSALAVNYDLYLANFNSLNKRMGELRNTQESNGVWARVFGGAMSNDFGVGSKTDYITTQAEYDYSLSVGENARNFIGVAIAYGASSTKSNPSSNPNTGVLDNISSSMVEVGVYNSYVADSGWYNDTIFKFDYIMSDFTLKTGSNSQQNSTSNFAMILSDEFGYRYSFGENEKGSWYIDPQAEFAFGYFNQGDFNQALNESGTRTIKATQDSILTLRSRVGASLGKKFNTDKGFASLYVGAFYEYDYIEGGKSDYSLISSGQEVSNPLQSLESNGRAILNVGSNIELTKGARLYIDVEKSFGDKQRTFMQFNLGARYSF